MESGGYFRTKSGEKIYFVEIAQRIKNEHPQLKGRHIFVQLEALGLSADFAQGTTPCALPFTFI